MNLARRVKRSLDDEVTGRKGVTKEIIQYLKDQLNVLSSNKSSVLSRGKNDVSLF